MAEDGKSGVLQGGTSYVPGVHAARAVAISAVLLAHIVGLWANAVGASWLPWTAYTSIISRLRIDHQAGGHAGLLLFFLVSGYIVSQAADSDTPLAFAVKRAARVLPAMAVAVALTLAVAAVGSRFGWVPIVQFDPGRAFSPWAILEAIGLASAFGPTAILFPLWTLTIEIYWYFLLAIAMMVLGHRPLAVTVALTALIAALMVWGRFLGPLQLGGGYPYVLPILVGRWMYLGASGHTRLIVATAGGAASAALYAFTVLRSETSPEVALLRVTSLAWAVAGFLALLILVRRGPWRPVAFVADISYGLYLFHIPVMWVVMPVMSPDGNLFPLALGATVGITVAVAWLSYRYVETPARRWVRARRLGHSGGLAKRESQTREPATQHRE